MVALLAKFFLAVFQDLIYFVGQLDQLLVVGFSRSAFAQFPPFSLVVCHGDAKAMARPLCLLEDDR
jgi:hypothetical protein